MHRVFLAHGDGAAREKIRTGLNWDSSGFVLVGEASDGELALPMIYDLHPDILIADLRMPFMDGLEFAQEVRGHFPWVQVILLSNSADAGLCREHLKTTVDEHLFKPAVPHELEDALRRSAGRIAQLHNSIADRIRNTKLPQVRRRGVKEIGGWIDSGIIPPDAHRPHMKRFNRLVCLMQMEDDIREIAFGLLCLMEKEIPDGIFAFELGGTPCMLLSGDDELSLEDRVYRAAHIICRAVEYFTGRRLRVLIGEAAEDLVGLRASWLDLARIAEETPASRQIYAASDERFYRGRALSSVSAMAERLTCMGHNEVETSLNNYSRKDAMLPGMFENAVRLMLAEAGAPDGSAVSGNGDFDSLARMLHAAIDRRNALVPDMEQLPLNRARRYASIYFQMPGVLRYNAAKLEGLSVNRFSVIFHQEMGMNFTDYIFTMRINAAKWLLATRMRISRVAETVGFSELSYFESLFRRMTGMDPREYRRKLKQ